VYEPWSVARYQSDAAEALHQTRTDGKLPIFVGGTGLYFHALTQGLAEVPKIPDAVRERVRTRREAIGAEAFHEELAARDPESAARLRVSDTQRVLRAAEVLEATGMPLAHWQQNPGAAPLAGLQLACFVLSPPRAELYRRIERRFDRMLAEGALEEARLLKELDPALPSAKARPRLMTRPPRQRLRHASTPSASSPGSAAAWRIGYGSRQRRRAKPSCKC
jgi:tRNA dimethylallyltransferase